MVDVFEWPSSFWSVAISTPLRIAFVAKLCRKPQPGSGNHAAHGTVGNKGGGRRPGRTLLLPVMSLPEDVADFVRYEQVRRDAADPRETVREILAEQALLFHERRRVADDPAYFVG